MFQPGDLIIYGEHGVCEVLDNNITNRDVETIPHYNK